MLLGASLLVIKVSKSAQVSCWEDLFFLLTYKGRDHKAPCTVVGILSHKAQALGWACLTCDRHSISVGIQKTDPVCLSLYLLTYRL